MATITFTDEDFPTKVEQATGKPVLVDFWAEWCGPCRVQGPIVEEVANEMEDKAVVGAIEVDEHPKYPQKYGVMSIPTIMIFKDGNVVWQASGVQEKSTLINELTKAAS